MKNDENNNLLKFEQSLKERLKNHKNVDPWSKKGIEEREEFYKLHGRGWFWFTNTVFVPKYADSWIEQFRVKDTDGKK